MTSAALRRGATLQVLDGETGEVIEEWVSGAEAHQINAKLVAGKTYRLKEITAPDGYLVAEEIEFTISTDGSVDAVTMHNDWTKVEIGKVWTAAGFPETALSGALLRIMDGNTIVMEFTSGDAPQRINAKLAPGNYTLVEVSAPDGYILSTPVPFTVSDDGSVDRVKMEDKATDVTISKRTMTGTDELPGATLTLYDAEGNIVKKWVSGKTPTRFVAELLPGASYTLVEEIAPKGYKIAEPITFVVNEDGVPQVVVMRDALEESELPNTSETTTLPTLPTTPTSPTTGPTLPTLPSKPTGAPTTSPSPIASTGEDLALYQWGGIVFIATGAALLALRRRKKSES